MHVSSSYITCSYIPCADVHLGLHHLMMQRQELEIINRSIVEGQISSSILVRPLTFRGAPESLLLVFCRGRGLVPVSSYKSIRGFIDRVRVEVEGFFNKSVLEFLFHNEFMPLSYIVI